MTALKLIFMGTPEFSVPVLEQLIEAGHDVVCVYSQPPRPAGRGQKERPSPVHAAAQAHGIEVRTPVSLKSEEAQKEFAALNADAAIVVAYGLILPAHVLAAPRLGCINIHASLLPRWRGAAPIQRAIEAGDDVTGVTLMQMDEGLDTGDMLVVEKTPILPATTASDLHDRLSEMGAGLIAKTLPDIASGVIQPQPQPETGVTYAAKIDKREGRIDWTKPAIDIDRQIRAFTPWPGVWFEYNNDRVKVFSAEIVDRASDQPGGTVVDDVLTIACGEGAIRITELQRPGKKRAPAEEVLRGFKIEKGTRLAG